MKTIKGRVLTFLLTFVYGAFAAAWTGSTSEPENMKKIDGKPFYVITTADELAWFAAQVNAGQTTINAVLGNDILFGASTTKRSSQRWIPIGKDSSHIFNGILDGAGKTIYGLFATNEKFLGLIGIVGSSGIVRNLSLKNGKRSFVSYMPKWVSGVVAINHGTISNCVSGDTISFSSTNDFKDGYDGPVIGGIVAENKGNVEYCVNNGLFDVTVDYYYYVYLGGVSGLNSGNVIYSENNADLKFYDKNTNSGGSYYTDIGGSVGGCIGLNKKNINACKNIGAINATAHYIKTGGILGYNSGTITNCANHGMISIASRYSGGRKNVGGVVGVNSSQNFSNSFSIANIDSKNSVGTVNAGGIIGLNRKSVKNSFFNSTVLAKGNPIGIDSGTVNNVSGMTTASMQKDQFAWILNTSNGTEENSGVWTRGTDGFPTFANEDSLAIRKIVFNDDGVTSNRYTNYKGLADFPANPDPIEGYIFSGWYNSENVKVKPTTIFTADQTVNAGYVDASDVYYTINFYNEDKTLLKSYSAQHGSIVSYDGEDPVKVSSAEYSYSFAGWNVEPTNAVEDFDYYATYTSTKRSYSIEFRDYDGTLLQSSSNLYGAMPSYSNIPVRTSTVEWNYSYKGWKPAIESVSGEAVYTAVYDSSKVEYTVTFMNGSTVFETQQVAYGSSARTPSEKPFRDGYKFVGWSPSYARITTNLTISALFEELIYHTITIFDNDGNKVDNVDVVDEELYTLPAAPQKEGYEFIGWYNDDKLLGYSGDKIPVTADMSITAHYKILSYTVTFVDENGVVLKTSSVNYGTVPVAPSEPTKSANAKYTYSFTGWNPSVERVAGLAIYTALFDSTLNKYTITFMKGTEKLQSSEVAYGEVPEYNGLEPSRNATDKYSFKFRKWSPTIEPVTQNATYEAIFDSTEIIKSSSSSNPVSSSSEKIESSSSCELNALVATSVPLRFHLSVSGRNIQIAGANVGTAYALLDMQGRVLQKGRAVSTNFNIAIANAGRYFVRIDNQVQHVNVR